MYHFYLMNKMLKEVFVFSVQHILVAINISSIIEVFLQNINNTKQYP